MQYVYEHVATDVHSNQTPHFGFLEGDGDFIFSAPQLPSLIANERIDTDVLIELPESAIPISPAPLEQSLPDLLKEYLSDPRYRIKLDDKATAEIRGALHALRDEAFPLSLQPITPEKLSETVQLYEQAIERLVIVTGLVARWGEPQHQSILQNILSRLAERK
ncbi:MAG: hypothetical protein M3O30_19510 [Planctomycetota bacterium]|nr:hypothetical protein [Planctomycetota bacterium]